VRIDFGDADWESGPVLVHRGEWFTGDVTETGTDGRGRDDELPRRPRGDHGRRRCGTAASAGARGRTVDARRLYRQDRCGAAASGRDIETLAVVDSAVIRDVVDFVQYSLRLGARLWEQMGSSPIRWTAPICAEPCLTYPVTCRGFVSAGQTHC
jgi:hypothetical protein